MFKKPKYVFLFIGDGMGTAQIQSARFYQGTVTNNGAITEAELSFTQFGSCGGTFYVLSYDNSSLILSPPGPCCNVSWERFYCTRSEKEEKPW